MTIRKTSFIVALAAIALLSLPVAAQTVYLPTNHEAYEFLKRMEAKQYITGYRDAIQPIARRAVAEQLISLAESRGRMTAYERETFDVLRGEFAEEILSLDSTQAPVQLRQYLYSTETIGGTVHVSPRLHGDYLYSDSGNVFREAHGFNLQGSLFKDFGFYFNFVDNSERGSLADGQKRNSPDPGVIVTVAKPNHIEYDMTLAQLSWRWKQLDVSIENFENKWSLGRRGSLAFSRKAPPFAQVKLRFPLASWIDFIYIHGELKSDVVDSARSYFVDAGSLRVLRRVDRAKFIAAHMVEMTPVKGVDISFGESIVYSDRSPQLLYMIPLMFFKSGEHYNKDTDNSQFFGNLDVNLIPRVNLYTSIFIDEFSTGRALSGDRARNQYGLTAGVETFDAGVEGLECLLEYSYINPWVYNHKFEAARFTNNGFDMGHWIGQNADNLFLQFVYRPSHDWKFGVNAEMYRKGDTTDGRWQYDDTKVFELLFGRRHEERSIGFFGTWQPMRDLFADLRVRFVKVDDEQAPAKSHPFRPEISVGITYGIW